WRLLPTLPDKRASTAVPVFRIIVGARQQFVRASRRDDVGGAVGPELRELGVVRNGEKQNLAGVGVDRGKQRRVAQVKVSLVKRDLRGILWESLKSVTLERAPALVAKRFVFP